jgi:flagellar hook-basal body complex protein FliE
MSPAVGPVAAVGVSGPGSASAALGAFGRAASPQPAGGVDFASAMVAGLESVQQMQNASQELSVKAVSGELTDVHDYTIAATQAAVATELTVAVRNKAVEAFQEIMRMQV